MVRHGLILTVAASFLMGAADPGEREDRYCNGTPTDMRYPDGSPTKVDDVNRYPNGTDLQQGNRWFYPDGSLLRQGENFYYSDGSPMVRDGVCYTHTGVAHAECPPNLLGHATYQRQGTDGFVFVTINPQSSALGSLIFKEASSVGTDYFTIFSRYGHVYKPICFPNEAGLPK